MPVLVESKRKSETTLRNRYPDAEIVDVTSRGDEPYLKLSPFYPHGHIPVPYSDGYYAQSVEGIWQGLKVFESADVDLRSFENTTMKNLKRTVAKLGKPLGHRKGVKGTTLLGYIEARKLIYLPSYLWMLENKAQDIISSLKEKSARTEILLLDYDTNGDVENPAKPLSHAYLIKYYLEDNYPVF